MYVSTFVRWKIHEINGTFIQIGGIDQQLNSNPIWHTNVLKYWCIWMYAYKIRFRRVISAQIEPKYVLRITLDDSAIIVLSSFIPGIPWIAIKISFSRAIRILLKDSFAMGICDVDTSWVITQEEVRYRRLMIHAIMAIMLKIKSRWAHFLCIQHIRFLLYIMNINFFL